MKFLHILLISLGLASILGAAPRGQPVDGFAAEVAGHVITVGDVIEAIGPALRQLPRTYEGRELAEKQAELFNRGLERLIEQKLMVAHFEKMEAELPAGAVRERTETILRERFDNDRSKLLATLRRVGKSEQEWEDEIREQIIEQSMVQQFVQRQIHVSPREIREAYEARKDDLLREVELKLRAIAFRPAPEDEAASRAERIAEVQKRLKAGESFAELAREISDGPKADEGGAQGWIALSSLPDALRDPLSDARPGDITPLIDTPVQSYIFKIQDRRGGDVAPLAEVQPRLEADIRAEKHDRIYENWILGLRKEFPVQRFNPDISAVTGEQ